MPKTKQVTNTEGKKPERVKAAHRGVRFRDPGVLDRLDAIADREDRSVNWLIESACEQMLERMEAEETKDV